jgi:hypothetical protein
MKEEGRRKKEEGRRKKEEGRRQLYHFRLIRNCIIIIFVGAGSPRYLISIDKSYKPAPAIYSGSRCYEVQ